MNPELWDDLQDKTNSRECSFRSFQKNLIKGITLVVQLASKVVDAKKSKEDSISLNDVYDLTVDALTLLGNSVYEFSMKRRELLKSEFAPAYKSLCNESLPITTMLFGDELPQSIRNISQVKRMAAKSIGHDRPTLISKSLVLIRVIIADLVIMAGVIETSSAITSTANLHIRDVSLQRAPVQRQYNNEFASSNRLSSGRWPWLFGAILFFLE